MPSEDTREPWTRTLEDKASVPPEFLCAFAEVKKNNAPFTHVLYSPGFEIGRCLSPPYVLAVQSDGVACLERRADDRIHVTALRLNDVYRCGLGKVFLTGWLSLDGFSSQGAVSIRVDYNIACQEHYRAIIEGFRHKLYAGSTSNHRHELAKLRENERTNFKFANYARDSIEQGAEVRFFYSQPAVLNTSVGVVTSVVVPSSMTIVTQHELIVIQESETKSIVSYGGSWNFYLLDKIWQVTLTRDEVRKTVSMKLHLPGDAEQTYDYALANYAEIEHLAEAVRAARRAKHA